MLIGIGLILKQNEFVWRGVKRFYGINNIEFTIVALLTT
jgi:hypothetical protein